MSRPGSFGNRIGRLFAPASLRYQLLSRSFFILAGLLLLIGVFQFVFMQQFLYQNKAMTARDQIKQLPVDRIMAAAGIPFDTRGSDGGREGALRGDGGRPGPQGDAGLNGDAFHFFISDASLAFYSLAGEFTQLYANESLTSPPKLADTDYQRALQSSGSDSYQVVRDANGADQLVVLAPFIVRGQAVGVVELGTPVKPLHQLLVRQLLIFLALSIAALLFGLLTYLNVMKRTLIPLSTIVRTVEQINAGNLNERLPERQGQAEIDRLSYSFNGMLARLQTSFEAEKEAKEQMRRFVGDASHELRTPLTSIHGFLEILLRGAAANPDQLHKALTSMYGESERMNKLVQDLLQLTKMDRGPSVELKEASLADVLYEMEPQLRLLAGEREVHVRVADNTPALIDRDKMKQVILNLFHNAVQHTEPAGGVIDVSLETVEAGARGASGSAQDGGQTADGGSAQDGGQTAGGGSAQGSGLRARGAGELVLTVQDNGHGIAPEHLPHIFERFYRADSSRSRKIGGSGLGLSITQSIVEHHGGTIEAASRVGKGTRFTVRLPLTDLA